NGIMVSFLHVTDPTNTPGPPFVPSKMNFAPRAGLAWDPTGSGKTSIRVGGGLFFNHLDGRTWYNNATVTSSTQVSIALNKPVFPNQFAVGIPVGGAQNNNSIVFHPDTPSVVQYNLEVQRQLAPSLSLRVGYVGSHGYNLTRNREANTRIATTCQNGL